MPFIDQQSLYDRVDFEREPGVSWDRPVGSRGTNEAAMGIELAVARCPSDSAGTPLEGYAPTNYVVSVGKIGKGQAPLQDHLTLRDEFV